MVGHGKKTMGKGIQVPIGQTNPSEIQEQLDLLKSELLAELAKILGEVQVAQLLKTQTVTTDKPIQDDSQEPIYIPEIIGTGENIETQINIQTQESDNQQLEDAMNALKKIKSLNKEDNNE